MNVLRRSLSSWAQFAVRLSALWSIILLSWSGANADSAYPFVPENFEVPKVLETGQFRLRMLTVNDLIKDYDAVMSSEAHIKAIGPGAQWPTGLTLEEDLVDLGWHQKEFQNRTSFAFTVVELDESRVIGCVYINPTRKQGYDAEVTLWTRPPEQVSFINEEILYLAVKQWLDEDWPFQSPAFLGTEIPWDAFSEIADAD